MKSPRRQACRGHPSSVPIYSPGKPFYLLPAFIPRVGLRLGRYAIFLGMLDG